MSSVTFPINIGGDGSTVTDDSNASTGLANGGHRTRFVPALSQIVNIASTFVANASNAAAISGSAFRNKLINGDFQVWQENTTFTDAASITTMYTADNWAVFRQAWALGFTATQQSTQINSKSIRVQRTAGNTLTNFLSLSQTFETIEVKKLAGKQLTLSFKALKGANFSATSSILQAQIVWGFGSDGNLGSGFTTPASSTVNVVLTTTNTLFTVTGTVPSNATQLGVQFYYTPAAGTAGAADYFEITDVQLEEGANATAFERRPYHFELLAASRYYQKVANILSGGYQAAGGHVYTNYLLPVTMRQIPTVSFGTIGYSNASGLTTWITEVDRVTSDIIITATGYGYAQHSLILNARL